MRRAVTTVLVGLCVALLGAGGCSGDDEEDADPTTTSAPETSTTTEEPTTTTTTTAPALPELENTGEDFVAIMQSLGDYTNALGQNPDVAAVDSLYEPGSPAHANAVRITEQLIQMDAAWDGPVEVLEEIQVQSRVDDATALVSLISRPVLETRLLRSDGSLVQTVADQTPAAGRYVYSLRRGEDQRWRITDVTRVGDA